jgi:hypothetical protein
LVQPILLKDYIILSLAKFVILLLYFHSIRVKKYVEFFTTYNEQHMILILEFLNILILLFLITVTVVIFHMIPDNKQHVNIDARILLKRMLSNIKWEV